jgi:hypothetical protein
MPNLSPGIKTRHFRVSYPPGNIRNVWLPGFGLIRKKLSVTLPVIEQWGICTVDQTTRDSVTYGKGDPAVTTTVDTLNGVSFTSCYKADADVEPEMTGDGGVTRYRIRWEQVTA